MSNYHVRAGLKDGNAYHIIFHIPIPATNNRIGIPYRDALVRSGIGGSTVMVEGLLAGQITSTEKTQIANGELYEHSEEIPTHPGETAAQYQSRLDARYNELANTSGKFLQELRRRIEYWGHDRNVA